MIKYKKIIIGIIIIVIPIILIKIFMFIVFNFLTLSTPLISAPGEKQNKTVNYNYSNSDFENCYNDSKNIYDVAACYNERNLEITKEEKSINHSGNIKILLTIEEGHINRYDIISSEYSMWLGDTGSEDVGVISFTYPKNELLDSTVNRNHTYNNVDKDTFDNINSEIQNDEILIEDNFITIPFLNDNSEIFLELLTFNEDDSEKFLEKINNYLQ